MDSSDHSILAGESADKFAEAHKLQIVPNKSFDTFYRLEQLQDQSSRPHGQTVGVVAMDIHGNLGGVSIDILGLA